MACQRCNGHKGSKEDQGYWPHQHNTYLAFTYKDKGYIDVHPSLSPLSKEKARTLLELVDLGNPKLRQERSETWELAQRWHKYYVNKQEDFSLDCLKDVVTYYGHWSVWFTVFQDIPALRQWLVEAFPGTARDCFDENYNPIPRNPQNEQDTL